MAGCSSSRSAGNKSRAEQAMLPTIQEVGVVQPGQSRRGLVGGWTGQIIKCDLGMGCCPAS